MNYVSKQLAKITLVGALALSGCNGHTEGNKSNLPDFAVRRPEKMWVMGGNPSLRYSRDGFTYEPHVVQSTIDPYQWDLRGVVAKQGKKKYIFLDGMADGRLTSVSGTNNNELPYGRMGALPGSINEFVNSAGEGADLTYKLFREELCTER